MIGPGPVLVVAAHPDDETIGCGGFLARLAAQGTDTHVVICTRPGPYLGRYRAVRDPEGRRREDAMGACRVLGVSSVHFGSFEETNLTGRAMVDLTEFLRGLAAEIQPSLVLTHSRFDLHQDHRVVCEVSMIAFRAYLRGSVRALWSYSSDVLPFNQPVAPQTGVFVDITSVLERKIEALNRYTMEVMPPPHPRSDDTLRARARVVGGMAGMEAAEAFELLWGVW